MMPREEAERLYDKFHQYKWDENEGYVTDHKGTIKIVNMVLDEIESNLPNNGMTFWTHVRTELNRNE